MDSQSVQVTDPTDERSVAFWQRLEDEEQSA
jgi:hypothetical protein